MKWVDLYIDSLAELIEKEKDGLETIKDLPIHIGFKIGLSFSSRGTLMGTTVYDLKDHVRKLITETNMREDFVVLSLVSETTRLVERNLTGHGDAIALFLSTWKNEETKETSLERIEELTSVNHLFNVRSAIDTWKQIVSVNFSTAQIDAMEREILLEKLS